MNSGERGGNAGGRAVHGDGTDGAVCDGHRAVLLAEAMPKEVPPEPEVVTEMEPVPVPPPMVLPVSVPMFTWPWAT